MAKPQFVAHKLGAIFRNIGISTLTLLWLAACGGVSDGVPDGEFVAPVVEWQIVFEDEFDGASLDTAKWNVELGDGCPDNCGWGNNELQVYGTDNISVAGGVLSIEGRQELDGSYTSGRLNTNGTFDFQYGRVEVSARIPSGQGTWPAIWLLHSDPTIYGPWPLSGEIDIMEAFNYGVGGNASTQSTTHYGLPIEPFNGTLSRTDLSVNADLNFHEYAVEWEKDKIRFFVDGQHYQTQNSDNWFTYYPADEGGLYDPFGPYTLGLEDAPFDQAFHLLINFAIGGNPVGNPDMSTVFPQTMEIDYVRVYECANANPGTGRGCGTADASVVPLEDLDGGPLENAVTEQPYVEVLDLYLDGPETITLKVGEETGSNTLQAVVGFAGDNATVTNDPAFADPDDAANTVWHVSIAGDVANVLLTGEDLTDDPILDTGFDVSGGGLGGDPVGEIAFDMKVNSVGAGANLFVKLDSGFPNLGEVLIPQSELLVGDWKTYSVKFDDLLANPGFVDCCGGGGVDLANVLNPFVFEVSGGDADVYLDNIRLTNACYVVGACGAGPRTKGIRDLLVFDDAVNLAVWDRGIVGSDGGSGFVDYTDGTNPANKVNWQVITDIDPERGEVVDVTFNDSSAFGVWFFGSSGAVDTNAYAAGAVVFDLIVDDYGNGDGMTMKIDCFFPCSSGDKNLGRVADGVWETITVPVARLTPDLDLDNVNVGLVLFPTTQSGTIRFRVDNVRWVADSDAIPLEQIDLPVTFDDPLTDYSLTDFGGTATGIVDDPAGGTNQVAQTTHSGGPFAGTVIGTGAGFANPIPFTATETTMSIRVRSPAAGVPIMLKIEDSADGGIFAESPVVLTTAVDEWETLVFDFAGLIDPDNVTYDKAALFFNFPNAGDGAVYYWDDVAFGSGPTLAPIDLPVTFEDPAVDYSLSDFEGASSVVGPDPADATNTVAATTKTAGSPFFAGTIVGKDFGGFATPIPFTATDTVMTVMVLSPAAGINVRLKVENSADGGIFAEVDVPTTVAGGWEKLSFDFASAPGFDPNLEYSKAIIFFDFVVDKPADGSTYYWDDMALGDLIQPIDLPVTFDEPFVDYTLSDFEGAATVLAGDPTGADNTVAATTKTAGSPFFAGTIVGKDFGGFASPIPFTATETVMSVRVYSPAAGIPVRLKVENASDGGLFAEMDAVTTVANGWEPLNFDFSTVGIDTTVEYSKAIIFFDFVVDKPADGSTYYWDDLQFGAAP